MASKRTQYVFAFGERTDGNAGMRDLLGGKGANLAEMARIGLPVPPGFTISTQVCRWYYEGDGDYPPGFADTVRAQLAVLESAQGKRFGAARDPLLVSVRSGARESMPGMMDTILNLGLNDETVEGLASTTGDARFAYDCYPPFHSHVRRCRPRCRRRVRVRGEPVRGNALTVSVRSSRYVTLASPRSARPSRPLSGRPTLPPMSSRTSTRP